MTFVVAACVLLVGPPSFELHTADGTTLSGSLAKLEADWSVSLAAPEAVHLPGAKFVSLRRTSTPLPPHPLGEQIILTDGDRLAGTLLSVNEERLRFRLAAGGEMAVPLSHVCVMWFTPVDSEKDAESALRRLAAQPRQRDIVIFRNGDAVEGTLQAIEGAGIRFRHEGKDQRLDRGKIAALALNSELAQVPRWKSAYAQLVLSDGSRLSLAEARAADSALQGRTLFGADVSFPLEHIIAIDSRQGPAVYLSDLKPKRYQHSPYLGVRWPFMNDSSVAGQPLRLAGGTYDRGIGLHSASRLTYDLDAAYRWFEATVGLDERTGQDGNVRIDVLVDGQAVNLGMETEIAGRDPPRRLRVAVKGAQELTLLVEFGRHGDVGDHVNWADARLIR